MGLGQVRATRDTGPMTTSQDRPDQAHDSHRHRVVVIGSGFGGLFGTKALRRSDVDVTMIAKTTHHLFQPLLYQVATGILSEGEIAPPTREVLAKQQNATVLLGDVTGIDLAPGSIAFARQYENDRLHFFVHDMRELLYANYFNYAFNFFTSFGYFDTRRENRNALRMVHVALRPKGQFILDYLNTRYSMPRLVPSETKTIGQTVYTITRRCDGRHFYKRIRIEDPELEQPLEYTEKVAAFTLEDFKDMLEHVGLHILGVYGDYALSPYEAHRSPRLILVTQKA